MGSKNRYDLAGNKYGELEVLERSGTKGNHKLWKCFCHACKKECHKISPSFASYTRSCGCLGARKGNESALWKGQGIIPAETFNRIKRTAISRKIAYDDDLTQEFLWELYLKQNGKCALSGRELKFGSLKRKQITGSLDRKDSSKGYSRDNVQWVIKEVNIAKHIMDENEFVSLCKDVAEFRKD